MKSIRERKWVNHLCVLVLCLLAITSCAVTDSTNSRRIVKLLFFSLDGGNTSDFCSTLAIITFFAIVGSKYRIKPGWRYSQILRGIRDDRKEVVGYYETGEYEKDYFISDEKAETWTNTMHSVSKVLRCATMIVGPSVLIIHQVFPNHLFWFILFTIVVSIIGTYTFYKRRKNWMIIWDIVYMVVLIFIAQYGDSVFN